jgi:TonB family protein
MYIDNPLFWGETPLKNQILSLVLLRMTNRPMPLPEPRRSSALRPPLPAATAPDTGLGPESDLAALVARFAEQSGGNFSAEVSTDLALEIVLNEIVEQACFATGATGAAIVLARDGEMVCRACSGPTAPELGARLDSESGISQECVRTHRLQKCDDAQSDPRADREASLRLGVRSVIVWPLLRNGEMVGLFEVFSTRASAFGERDQRTLEALAQRILQNLERAANPVIVPSALLAAPLPFISPAWAEATHRSSDAVLRGLREGGLVEGRSGEGRPDEGVGKVASGRGIEVATWALGLTVLACALLLGLLVTQRLGWRRVRAHTHSVKTDSAGVGLQGEYPPGEYQKSGNANDSGANESSAPPSSPSSAAAADASAVKSGQSSSSAQSPGSRKPGTQDSPSPAGSLMVYEKGREVFRMPPAPSAQGLAESPEAQGAGVQRASSVEPEPPVELSPAAAEGGLIHRVEPDYPEEARRQQIQGAVVLEVQINQDGAVKELRLVSGVPLLAQAATDAVKQWRFKPHTAKGHPVEMQTRVTLNFRLPN